MKKLFAWIQELGVPLAVLFSILPPFSYIAREAWGHWPFLLVLSVMTVTSAIMVVFLMWYLLAKFQVKKRGYFTAVGFAAYFAFLQGWVNVLFIKEVVPLFMYERTILSSMILLLGVLCGVFSEWFIKPLRGEVGGD